MLRKSLVAVVLFLALSSATAVAKPKPGTSPKPAQTVHAPEFDAKTAGAAVALLVGGALVLYERRRRQRN